VHLASTKEEDINAPSIDPNFFQVDFDLQTQMAIGKLAQAFWEQGPVKSLHPVPMPGRGLEGNATDTEWTALIKETCELQCNQQEEIAILTTIDSWAELSPRRDGEYDG
jgi:hypothetical protein